MKWDQIAEHVWKRNGGNNLDQSSFPLFKSICGRGWQGYKRTGKWTGEEEL